VISSISKERGSLKHFPWNLKEKSEDSRPESEKEAIGVQTTPIAAQVPNLDTGATAI
jgi:hypothetical protein